MSIILIKYLAYGLLSNVICVLGLLGNCLTLYIMNSSKDYIENGITLRFWMYGVLTNSICAFGLIGNSLMLYFFIHFPDMRRQSINIYLTVLALYDNAVLIFSILMLNLPAITDYQQQQALTPTPEVDASLPFSSLPFTMSAATSIANITNQPSSWMNFLQNSSFELHNRSMPVVKAAQILDTGQNQFADSRRTARAKNENNSRVVKKLSALSRTDTPSFITQNANQPMDFSIERYAENILVSCLNLTISQLADARRSMQIVARPNVNLDESLAWKGADNASADTNSLVREHLFFHTILTDLIRTLDTSPPELRPTIVDKGVCFKSLIRYHANFQPDARFELEEHSTDVLLLATLKEIVNFIPVIVPTSVVHDNNTSVNGSLPFDSNLLPEVDEQEQTETEFESGSGPNLIPLIYYVKIVYPLALFSQTGSIWTTCLITIERYLAVCHPLMSRTLSTRSRAITALSIMSAAALLFNFPRFFEVDTSDMSIRPTELRHNKIYYQVYYIGLNFVFNYIAPLSLLFVLNIKIYASVRHAANHRNELTRARQGELHLASMLVMIVAIFIACNAPSFVVNFLEVYLTMSSPVLDTFTVFSNLLVCFNSAVNFVIYCIFGKKFRSKLRQVLGLGCCCIEPDPVTSQRSLVSNGRPVYTNAHLNTTGAALNSHNVRITLSETLKLKTKENRARQFPSSSNGSSDLYSAKNGSNRTQSSTSFRASPTVSSIPSFEESCATTRRGHLAASKLHKQQQENARTRTDDDNERNHQEYPPLLSTPNSIDIDAINSNNSNIADQSESGNITKHSTSRNKPNTNSQTTLESTICFNGKNSTINAPIHDDGRNDDDEDAQNMNSNVSDDDDDDERRRRRKSRIQDNSDDDEEESNNFDNSPKPFNSLDTIV